ncbi:MAG TPA: hypothetical protein VFQ45_14765 [Longimicrobium sp.]|nr:hypothetical protein [Longimicrobium sp.]
MENIAGFDFAPVEFNKEGRVHDEAQVRALLDALPGQYTDLLVLSHGWNNDMGEARGLYQRFLSSARGLLDAGHGAGNGRRFVVMGIFWPSKKFADEDLIPGGGAASLGGPVDEGELVKRLEELKGFFDDPAADARLDEAKGLVPKLEDSGSARARFAELLASLAPADPAEGEVDADPSSALNALGADELLNQLGQPVLDNPPAGEGGTGGGGGSMEDAMAGMGGMGGGFAGEGVGGPGGMAAGLNIGGSLLNGARQLANLTTYYQMKKRAGIVGEQGLAPVLRAIRGRAPALKLHLVGHSFGGRLLTAAAAGAEGSAPLPVQTLTLLQAAFSHNAFAQNYFQSGKDGFFRRVLTAGHVTGPVLVSHTRNDKAVGLAYALASRLAGQQANAIGDENDKYGGIGSNGALFTPEADKMTMLASPQPYQLRPGRVHNLKADQYISGHGDVGNPATAYAVLCAVATT